MRDMLLAQTLVELSDSLAGSPDALSFLQVLVSGAARLLDTDAAGVVLADGDGGLRPAAASDGRASLHALLALQSTEGAGFDAHHSGELVAGDLSTSSQRWPAFAPAALALGYRSVCSLPLRISESRLGALTVFRASGIPLDDDQALIGRSLVDVTAMGLQQQRAVRQAELLAGQLQQALESRVVLEQAKGVLAERLDIDIAEAFHVLRRAARNSNARLPDYARMVIEGSRSGGAQKMPGSSPS